MDSKRHELKYIINKKYVDLLKSYLNAYMNLDNNSHYGDYYYIRSMYFDDYKNTAYEEKIDGIKYREKYRIRIYNFDNTYINLEKKIKDGDFVEKEKYKITKKQCEYILNEKYDKINEDDKLVNEFINKCKLKWLKPSVIVDYKRVAYTYPVENIRVTIDYDISSLGHNLDMFSEHFIPYDIMNQDEVLLEVKYDDYFPKYLDSILSLIPKVRVSFSKYTLCKEVDL